MFGSNWNSRRCLFSCQHFEIISDLLLKQAIGLMSRAFANGLEDWGSIPSRVIPKTQIIVPDATLFSTQHYKVRIKRKVEQSRNGVAPSPTLRCGSYWKRSCQVTLEKGRQLYLLYYDGWVVWFGFVWLGFMAYQPL